MLNYGRKKNGDSTSSTQFDDFFNIAIQYDTFHAEDKFRNDISDFVKNMIVPKGSKEVYEYFKSYSGSFGYVKSEIDHTTRAVDEMKNVTDSKYIIATDTKGKYRKEWRTRLVGTIYMDGNTGLIKRTSSPTLSLEWGNFGAMFSPYINSVTTSSSHTQSYATFRANYHMYATLGVSIGDLPIGYTLDFNSHLHEFRAS